MSDKPGQAGDGAGVMPESADRVIDELRTIWQKVLAIDNIGRDDDFFSLGGNSLSVMQVLEAAQRAGIRISARDVFEAPTLNSLSQAAGRAPEPKADRRSGKLPLTPAQGRFFSWDVVGPHHYNMADMYELPPGTSLDALLQAADDLQRIHDAFRFRFRRDSGEWRAVTAEVMLPVERVDLAGAADGEIADAIKLANRRIQPTLDLDQGPLARIVLLDFGEARSGRLLLMLHHLICDGWSKGILRHDLDAALRRAVDGGEPSLHRPPVTLADWLEELRRLATGSAIRAEAEYWLSLPWDEMRPVPSDNDDAVVTVGSLLHRPMELDDELSHRLLVEAPARGFRADEVILASIAVVLFEVTGSPTSVIDVYNHGRQAAVLDLDLSRTVGWLQNTLPLVVRDPAPRTVIRHPEDLIQQIRRVPSGGLGYGLLRYGPGRDDRLAELPQPDVLVNYRGQLGAMRELGEGNLMRQASDQPGFLKDPNGQEPYRLKFAVDHTKDRVLITLHHSPDVVSESRAGRILEHLKLTVADLCP